MRRIVRLLLAALSVSLLTACAGIQPHLLSPHLMTSEPRIDPVTASSYNLMTLPPPKARVAVAVYNYTDQTGQFRPTDGAQTLSRAVTQGGTSILIKALDDAANGQWFTVIERERLDNLMRERQIIREMRQRYLREEETPAEALPPLLFAGILLEGGVIGFDSNSITGGAGARYLGIGASQRYRQDTVTVYLRAVSVKTGEVLANVTTKKTIASHAISANAFRYVAFRELLEAELGVTTNEPDQLALRQAIEKAVHDLVLEGARRGLWEFDNPAAAAPLLDRYGDERLQGLSAAQRQTLDQPPIHKEAAQRRTMVSPTATPPASPPDPPIS